MTFLDSLKERARSKAFLAACAVLLVLGAGAAVWWSWSSRVAVARALVKNPRSGVEPLLASLNGLWMPPQDLKDEAEKRLKFELASFRQRIEKATRPEDFRAVDHVLAQLEAVCPPSLSKQVEVLKGFRGAREELVDYQAIDELAARDKAYGEPARAFVKKYPSSKMLAKVQTWVSRAEALSASKERAELESIKVATPADVEAKAAAIDAFLAKYPATRDATEMRRAAEVARKLMQTTSVRATLTGAGKFNGDRPFSVRVLVDGALGAEVHSPGAAQALAGDSECKVDWKPGQTITLVLYDYQFVNEEAARLTVGGVFALRALCVRSNLEPVGTWGAYFEGVPYVELAYADVAAEEWAFLDTYFPGAEF